MKRNNFHRDADARPKFSGGFQADDDQRDDTKARKLARVWTVLENKVLKSVIIPKST